VRAFVTEEVEPMERQASAFERESPERWQRESDAVRKLRMRARASGLWSFVDADAGFSLLEQTVLWEAMGASLLGARVFNCEEPRTTIAELLQRFGSDDQRAQWLTPMLRDGTVRGALAANGMRSLQTITSVRSTDDGSGDVLLSGRVCWVPGALHPNCGVVCVLAHDLDFRTCVSCVVGEQMRSGGLLTSLE
jgi:acyl-CoA dehydrogenase